MSIWSRLFGRSAEKPVEAAPDLPPASPAPRNDFAAVVDCSADPYDLRPATDAVMQQIEARLENMPPDQTLFVSFGEAHTVVSHQIFTQMVIQRLLAKNIPTALGLESAHNRIIEYMHDGVVSLGKVARSSALADAIDEVDEKGVISLSALLTDMSSSAPAARKNFVVFCLMNEVDTRLNDLAHGPSTEEIEFPLNSEDERTFDIIKNQDNPKEAPVVSAVGRRGVCYRNVFMCVSGMAHAKKSRPRVYIQQMGTDHVLGISPLHENYIASMMKFYSIHGLQTLSIVHGNARALAQDMQAAGIPARDVVVTENMATESFRWEAQDNTDPAMEPEDCFIMEYYIPGQDNAMRETWPVTLQEEHRVIEKIAERSGKEPLLYDADDISAAVKAELDASAKEILLKALALVDKQFKAGKLVIWGKPAKPALGQSLKSLRWNDMPAAGGAVRDDSRGDMPKPMKW